MRDWRDEYLSSIKDAELNNPVNMELVQACPDPFPLAANFCSHSQANRLANG